MWLALYIPHMLVCYETGMRVWYFQANGMREWSSANFGWIPVRFQGLVGVSHGLYMNLTSKFVAFWWLFVIHNIMQLLSLSTTQTSQCLSITAFFDALNHKPRCTTLSDTSLNTLGCFLCLEKVDFPLEQFCYCAFPVSLPVPDATCQAT